MPYKLKANVESFEVVDGPFAGRKYVSGEIYEEIPAAEKGRFEPVKQDALKTVKRPAETVKPEVTDA